MKSGSSAPNRRPARSGRRRGPSRRAARRRGPRPGHVAAGAAHDELAHAGEAGERLVGVGFQGGAAAAARGLVGGDHDPGAQVLDARAQRLGGEAGEDDGVHRADAGAGEHGVGGLGDHRQVDHHPVALLDAEPVQHVAELRHLLVQLAVADMRATVGVVALPDDRGLVGAGGEVAVDAVGGDVQRAVLEPLDRDVVVVEGGVLDPGVGLDPVEPLAMLAPEGVRVGDRGRVHRGVAFRVHVRLGDDLRRRLVQLVKHGRSPPGRSCPLPAGPGRVVPARANLICLLDFKL